MVVDQKGRDSASLLSYCASSSISLVTVCVTRQGCPVTHTLPLDRQKHMQARCMCTKLKQTHYLLKHLQSVNVCVCVSVCVRETTRARGWYDSRQRKAGQQTYLAG